MIGNAPGVLGNPAALLGLPLGLPLASKSSNSIGKYLHLESEKSVRLSSSYAPINVKPPWGAARGVAMGAE